MDTRKLECFIAVAEELHFRKAAEKLYLTQSTVSESIRSLEKDLGAQLFNRTSRRVSLTPLGEQLLHEIKPTLIALSTSLDDIRRRARGERPEIRIGYLGGGFYEFTEPIISEFQRLRPEITLSLVETDYTEHITAVREGKVDVALARLPIGVPDLVRGPILFQDQRMLAVASTHPLAGCDLVHPENLAGETMVQLPDGSATATWLSYHFPTSTPSGAPINPGPRIRTVREGLMAVASRQAVMTITGRAGGYFVHPGVTFVQIDLPPIQSALVFRSHDQRPVIRDLNAACARVCARMGVLVSQDSGVPA